MDSDLTNPTNAPSTSDAALSSVSTNSAVPTAAGAIPEPKLLESSTASSSLTKNSAVESIPTSCVFSPSRLRSFHGYRLNPPVNFGLDYRLPEFKFYHSRVVQVGAQQFLIWSPNSLQDPFYPGPYNLNGPVLISPEPAQRRFDGQGGPSDYTKVPQVYQLHRPWLGFILRESKALETDIEYTPVYSVWRDEPGESKEGRLPLPYVEKLVQQNSEMDRDMQFLIKRLGGQRTEFVACRPLVPTNVQLQKLRGIRAYQEAVDTLTELQRGMREKGAWLDMVSFLLHKPLHPEEIHEVQPANDRLLGVWINDANKEDCFWYLLHGAVPCFVIHRLPEAEHVTEDVCLDFFSRTEIEEYVLDARRYPADQVAFRERYRYTATEYNPTPHTTLPSNPGGWADLRALLRVRANEILPRDRPRECQSTDERNLLNRRRIMGAMTSPSTTPTGIKFARETRELQDKVLQAKADLEAENVRLGGEVDVDPAHAPWLRPPEIIQAGTGAWTTYREQDDEETGSPFMLELGKKNVARNLGPGEVMFWDRANNRRLIFEGAPDMPSGSWLTTGREFGRPVPKWPFKNAGHMVLREGRWSKWMYATEKPHPADVGRRPLAPDARYLPTVSGGLFEEGKGEWVRQDDDSDGRVSLGPATDGEQDKGDAMDVDDDPPTPTKANVDERPLLADAGRRWSPFQPLRSARSPPRRPRVLDPPPNPPPSVPRLGQSPPSLSNSLATASRAPMDRWTPRMGPASHSWRYPAAPLRDVPPTSAPPSSWSRPAVSLPRPPLIPPPVPLPPVAGPSRRNSPPRRSPWNRSTETSRRERSSSPIRPRSPPLLGRYRPDARLPAYNNREMRRSRSSSRRRGSYSPRRRDRAFPIALFAATPPFPVEFTSTGTERARALSLANSTNAAQTRSKCVAGPGRTLLLRLQAPAAPPARDLLQRLDLPVSEGSTASVFQRLGVPLQERVGEVREKRRRERGPHNRAAKRAKKEAELAAKRRESALNKEEEGSLQAALFHDAASQPAPVPTPAAPYEPPEYPEDWYN
ncbi:hypothetical protein B0H16DRAFT_1713863 [Mycena metata]|uniref:Uncharacterized protein n=1 Tax=Mycena metata TaxID=1033252 RepID=A0AAD7K009_9AGAR|nr:hypothetical protein B0H16DRAFT_1713863 [Mycena metata]